MTQSTAGDPTNAIGFCFFTLIVGSFFTWALSRTGVKKYVALPYTVLVFFYGIIMSLVAKAISDKGGVDAEDSMIRSTEQWMNIDPDLMLYVLLPPLLFSEAMKLDSHQVRLAIVPSALIALPGAAFGAYMQGLVCFYLLPTYEWEWMFCFMVGSVLSATDPVSVVSMLKSVKGGSTSTVKLTYLITGESLLNDGTALVIFEAIVSEHYDTDFSVVMYFVKVILISPFLGAALGLLTIESMKLARRRLSIEHNTVQMALTVSCSYISFFLAQYVLEVSGIISCCAAGVIIAWLSPPLILQPEQMEVLWHMLEWVGNTMIFAVAGLIVGKYSDVVSGWDVLAIFIIYITMMTIRFTMLSICYPFTKYMVPEYSVKDLVFSTYGGLRGAISLALVLIIEKHLAPADAHIDDHDTTRYFDAQDGERAMFVICGVVAMTIIVNGSTAGNFFSWLYGSRVSDLECDEIIFHYVEKRIRRRAREFISRKKDLPPFDPDEVKKLVSVFDYHFSTAPTSSRPSQQHIPQMAPHLTADLLKAEASGSKEIDYIHDKEGHVRTVDQLRLSDMIGVSSD